MSEQLTETQPEEADDCYVHCVECGEPIWEDCYYCNQCLRDFKHRDEPDEYAYDGG